MASVFIAFDREYYAKMISVNYTGHPTRAIA